VKIDDLKHEELDGTVIAVRLGGAFIYIYISIET
jgi:hypothetical protein